MEKTILVVEDEPIIGLELQEHLQSQGYRVPPVIPDGDSVLGAVAACRPDLIMMDVRIGGSIDGIEAARQVRQVHDLPILFLTAYSDVATVKRAAAVHADGYLIKPFAERELLANIQLALDKHEKRQSGIASLSGYVPVVDAIEGAALLFDTDGVLYHMNVPAMLRLNLPDASGCADVGLYGLVDNPDDADGRIRAGLHALGGRFASAQSTHIRLEYLSDRLGQPRGLIGFIEGGREGEGKLRSDALSSAARILESIIPADGSLRPKLDHAAFLVASPSGSGDLADVFSIGRDRFAFYNLDVMGHGTLPSLIAFSLHDQIRLMTASLVHSMGDKFSPIALLATLNRRFEKGSGSMFFTISMGTVDVGTGEWVLCRAGHTSALIIERGGQTTSICGEGMALGAFEHVRLEESRGVLGRGDRLILCSDGLLEALGAESAAGALERLSKMAQSYLGDPLPVLTGAIRRLCESRGRDLQDDASLLVISRP